MNELKEIRRDIQEVLQQVMPDGNLVVGWAMVVETIDPSGTRYLARVDGCDDGRGIPSWQRGGYFHDALYGKWDETPTDM